MTSQPGSQKITIDMLLNISQIKGNQIMEFGQIIDYNKRIIILQKSCRKRGKEAERLVPDLFLFSLKELYKVKVSGMWLSFTIF